MCQARFVRATGVSVNERGMLIVTTDDAKLPSLVVDAHDYPNMRCVSCGSEVLAGCSTSAHDIMTEDAVIPLDFKRFPKLRGELDAMVNAHPLELRNLHNHYVKEDIR